MNQARWDIVLGLALAAFGCTIIAGTYAIPPPVFETFGAAPVPRTAAIILVLLSALMIARAVPASIRLANRTPATKDPTPWLQAAAVVAVLFAHASAIRYLEVGFIVATSAALILMFAILGGLRPRFLLVAAVLAMLIPAALFLAFTRVFYIDLP